ncbi:MAG: hypothetical protein ABIJ56_12300 [Pseudomonadota bacterium]
MPGYTVTYKNKKFRKEKVELDGKVFVGCEFDECIIILETGETDLRNCRINKCRLMLKGAAYTVAKIIKLFSGQAPLKVLDLDEPLFEKKPDE